MPSSSHQILSFSSTPKCLPSSSPPLSTRPFLPSQSMSISLSITITMRALSLTMLWCVQFSPTENGKCVRSRGRNSWSVDWATPSKCDACSLRHTHTPTSLATLPSPFPCHASDRCF
ncbi:hypothetical protein BLNAU_10468 [Blattamonas nauphoetae]|uniref:Uncharacterized protein n=1 Tax=Blattamonas nauphoetae TaxID=2049346 RepID=A0ABQ9XS93_9EUKA|nr:hypothetical protein BLNAU_10468 [Blattamonas nauphoetae]